MESTRCQCYNQGTPTSEVCDGIDNNCDGMIDNNDACCSAGQTRPCGPSNNTGICTMGTSLCNNGVFGSCQGAVFPSAEVCGDGLDNDCDGQVDNGCSASACGEGEITSPCICEGSLRGSGYCCSGLYSTEECAQSPWWILIITGIIILIILVILVMYFRSQGKELTWEELRNRYSNKYFPF